MAYINGKKIMQVVKTVATPQYYRHQVKCELRGQQEELLYTAYLDFISTDETELDGYQISDLPSEFTNGYETIIYCYDANNNTFTYATYEGRATGVGYLYTNIENQTSSVQVDLGSFTIVEDTVTPIN